MWLRVVWFQNNGILIKPEGLLYWKREYKVPPQSVR